MRDAGYTLVECLAALAILGLASTGLLRCGQMLAQHHERVTRSATAARDLREAQAMLDRLLENAGPFGAHQPARFTGDTQGFRFDCGRSAPCQVMLVAQGAGIALRIEETPGQGRALDLHAAGPAAFVYTGALGPSPAWPPQRPERQALRAVSVVATGPTDEQAVLSSAIWREQPAVCAFDPVLQDCR